MVDYQMRITWHAQFVSNLHVPLAAEGMPKETSGWNGGHDRQFACGRMFCSESHTLQMLGAVLGWLVVFKRLDECHLHLRLVPALHIEIAEGVIEANGPTR